MTVTIEPLVNQSISDLIFISTGLKLGSEEASNLEFCQKMSSEIWSGYVEGKLICCWGLIPPTLLSNQAYLWMHSTPAVREHAFLIVRHSQKIVEKALERYPRIVGHCLATAADSIRWLRWLGARFIEADGPFIPFEITEKSQLRRRVANG